MADALVIGGGPAGATAAVMLARGGRSVVLMERTARPEHKVCGEFLSGEALLYLAELGVSLAALGAAPITRVRLVAQQTLAEAKLPFAAVSLTRRTLDEALLGCACEAGVVVERGASVENVNEDGAKWWAAARGGERKGAANILIAAGKHDLRGRARPPGRQGDLVAFKMYFRLAAKQTAELDGAVELLLFDGGYAGLQMVEEGNANLCLLVNRRQLKRCENRWTVLLEHILMQAPHLAQRLAGATPMLERPLALSSIPYGFVRQKTCAGLWWLGDQAAVIPSFSGDGMSIALHSARLAAQRLLEGKTSQQYQRELYDELSRQVRLATVLSQLLVQAPVMARIAFVFPWLLTGLAKVTRIPHVLAGARLKS